MKQQKQNKKQKQNKEKQRLFSFLCISLSLSLSVVRGRRWTASSLATRKLPWKLRRMDAKVACRRLLALVSSSNLLLFR